MGSAHASVGTSSYTAMDNEKNIVSRPFSDLRVFKNSPVCPGSTNTIVVWSTLHSERGLYWEGHGDVVSRLIMGVIRLLIWLIGAINLLTKSPKPPSTSH